MRLSAKPASPDVTSGSGAGGWEPARESDAGQAQHFRLLPEADIGVRQQGERRGYRGPGPGLSHFLPGPLPRPRHPGGLGFPLGPPLRKRKRPVGQRGVKTTTTSAGRGCHNARSYSEQAVSVFCFFVAARPPQLKASRLNSGASSSAAAAGEAARPQSCKVSLAVAAILD